MYKSLFLLIALNMAWADTALKVSAPPTQRQLETAARILGEAAELPVEQAARATKVKKARKLTEDRSVTKRFQAELHCDGKKQFEDDESADPPTSCCYKGDAREAQELVEVAVKQANEWQWDEYFMKSVSTVGDTVKIVLTDGPNEVDTDIIAAKCRGE